jgi:hypothetical protein
MKMKITVYLYVYFFSKENLENAVPVKDRIKQFEFGSDIRETQSSSKAVSRSQPESELMDSSTPQVTDEALCV